MERLYCNKCGFEKPESDFSSVARAQARSGDDLAMCQSCVNWMYRSRMDPYEAVAYLEQDTQRKLERHRLDGQEERKHKDSRWGRAYHHSELILELRRMIPNLVVADGTLPETISLYRVGPSGRVDFLCWMEAGYMPEFSIVHVNARNLPIREQRGWRTVLLRLIKAGVITEEQVGLRFGVPIGINARFYLAHLQDHRNRSYQSAA